MPTRERWKRYERLLADKLGGNRVPCIGKRAADIICEDWQFEVKVRDNLPLWLLKAVEQSEHESEGRRSAVLLIEARRGRPAQYFALMRLDTFIKLIH